MYLHLFIYVYVCVCSVHKHLRATVWTEMMSKLQASKWFINKQNQSTEATRPATVSPPPPFANHSACLPWSQLMTTVWAEEGSGRVSTTFNQNPNNRNFWPMQEAFPSLYIRVCVCRSILEISSFQQHFRQLNHVRNEKWTCPRRMWPEQLGSGWCFGAIILTRLQAGASKIYNMT